MGKAFNLRAEGPEGVAELHIDSFSTDERRRLLEMLYDLVYGNISLGHQSEQTAVTRSPNGQNDQAVTRSPQTERSSQPASIPAPVTTAPPVTSAASASAASGTEATGQSATEAHASAAPQQNSAEDDEELRKFLAECNEWM